MQREKSVETVENLGFTPESRLIGEKISNTTRYGVYCLDSPTGQAVGTVVGEEKAKMGLAAQSEQWPGAAGGKAWFHDGSCPDAVPDLGSRKSEEHAAYSGCGKRAE
jgi:hypothetical protein